MCCTFCGRTLPSFLVADTCEHLTRRWGARLSAAWKRNWSRLRPREGTNRDDAPQSTSPQLCQTLDAPSPLSTPTKRGPGHAQGLNKVRRDHQAGAFRRSSSTTHQLDLSPHFNSTAHHVSGLPTPPSPRPSRYLGMPANASRRRTATALLSRSAVRAALVTSSPSPASPPYRDAAAVGADGAAGDPPCFTPPAARSARRGWADPPADRAAAPRSGDAHLDVMPARRCRRDRRGLADRGRHPSSRSRWC